MLMVSYESDFGVFSIDNLLKSLDANSIFLIFYEMNQV